MEKNPMEKEIIPDSGQKSPPASTVHQPKDYSHLLGNLPGMSDKQLENHFELYRGYVKKHNEIEEKLKSADPSTANYSYGEISELLRRRPVAYNGMMLHEMFFDGLTKESMQPGTEVVDAISREFGTMDKWWSHVKAALVSEPGWVLLCRSRDDGKLRNILISQHHVGLLPNNDILLALDGWEHAYFLDYGVKKADYLTALQKIINWNLVTHRWEGAQIGSRMDVSRPSAA